MKILPVLAFILSSAAATFASASVPVFNATLTVGKESRFVLLGADGAASPWLKLGDSFQGYTLKAYDAKANALDLDHAGQVIRVSIAPDAKVANGGLAATPATIADATKVLDSMHFEQMLDRTLAGVKKQQIAMIDRMMAQLAKPGTDRKDVVAFQQKVIDTMMSDVNGADMKEDVAKIYSEVFSKDELDGLANFYSSPLGQSFSDKQPVLAQKMNEVMMPRMMAVMPKIQQMSREFAAEQQAKQQAAAAPAAPAPAPAAAPAPKR